MCGGKGGQTGTSNQATQTSIPPEVLQRYNQVYARGEQAANQPFQSYTGQFVAPVNETQQAGIQNIANAGQTYQPYANSAVNTLNPALQGASAAFSNARGAASPYNSGAAGLIGGSVDASSPLTSGQINQYMNPYTQNVVNATTGWLNQQNQQQQNALSSDAIMSGAFGGDRAGIAKGVLSGQQNLANASTIAGLYNQNYAQGLAAAQQQQGQRVGALQQGAQLTGNLGNQVFGQNIQAGQAMQNLGTQGAQAYSGLGQQAFNNQIGYGQALMGAGQVEQQTNQADLSARYNQFLQQQAYPFQSTQFLSNLATGQGALSGSTSQSYAYQPQPFFSDDKLKENVQTIGHTKDGLKIVRYNFKGDDKLRIGFLASDVEQKMPDAVSEHGGVRAVDYERAARARGGVVPHTSERWPDFDPAKLREMSDADTASQDVADPGMGVVRGVQEGRSLGDILSRTRGFGGPEGTILGDILEGDDIGEIAGNAGKSLLGPGAGLLGLAEGGRAGFAEGGYNPQTFAAMLQAHQAMYPGAMGRAGMGDSGPRGMKLNQSRPQMMKAEQPKMAPPPESTMKGAMSGVTDFANTAKSAKDLYNTGRDIYDWATDKDPLAKTGDRAARAAVTANGVAPAPADSSSNGADASDGMGAHDGQALGLVPDAAPALDAGTDVASSTSDLLGNFEDFGGFFAQRGGRAARAPGGGIKGDIPYDPKDDGGYFPDDLDNPSDPAKEMAEQKGLINKDSQQKSGSGGGGAGDILGSVAKLAPLAMMFIKRGGRVEDHDGTVQRARHAIGTIESGNRYDIVGPVTGGDRPYGRYQIMGANIPSWTAEVLGKSMTPQEFVASPEAQDAVFKGKFGQYVQKYGQEGAARAWFAGEGGMNNPDAKDVLGTSVADYARRFTRGMGEGGDEPRVAGLAPRDDTASAEPGERHHDINLTARTLNELGLKSGGRAGYEVGGGVDERGEPLQAQLVMPAMAPGVAPPPPPDEPRPSPLDPSAHPSVSAIDRKEELLHPAANVPADAPRPAPAPTHAPAAPAAAAPGVVPPSAIPAQVPAQVPAPAPDLAAGVAPKEEPGVFDRHGWLDRNERPVMTALSFLGNMLSSPSRTLAGAVGQGMVGAAQTWPSMGFKQQGLDIEQQQANTNQLGKVQDAINLTAAQRAEQLRLNPNASTVAHDAVMKGLVGKMGELLKTPGMDKMPVGVNYQNYFKTLPPDTQEVVKRLNTQDNPWLLDALAASVTDPRGKAEYIRLRDQAAERLRSGQARDSSGLQIVAAPHLTSALLQFQTQQQSASSAGAQLTPENRIVKARQGAAQILAEAGVAGPEDLTPEKRAQYEDLQRQIVTNQQAIGASTNPGVAPRQSGGRAGYDTGGLVPSDDGDGAPDIQLAQAAPPPSSSTDQNDPEFWRKRGNALGGLGAKEESDAAIRRAQDIEASRRDTGKRTSPKGETETNPGSIATSQQQQAAAAMVAQNTKLRDELFERAQMGNQALQLAKELRTTMFDEKGKPNSSMGPFNEVMNKAGGVFQQLGVPAHVLKSLNINVADKQASEKLQASIAAAIAHGDLGPNVRQSQFYTFMNAATPNMGMAPAAAQFIIDNVLNPRAQLEVDAYRSIKDLPPTENHQNRFYDWQLENPWYKGARIQQEQAPQQRGAAPGEVPTPLRGIKGLERSESTGQYLDRATGDVYAPDGKTKIGNIGKKP